MDDPVSRLTATITSVDLDGFFPSAPRRMGGLPNTGNEVVVKSCVACCGLLCWYDPLRSFDVSVFFIAADFI